MHNHHQQPSFTATIRTSSSSSANTTPTIPAPCVLLGTAIFCLFLIFTFSPSPPPPPRTLPHPSLFPPHSPHRLLFFTDNSKPNEEAAPPLPPPPSIAYLISGSSNDTGRIIRLLLSIYHPKNVYLLHLDSNAPQSERDALARKIQSFPLFKAAQNVNVIGKADVVYLKGSSSLSATLHGASILLRISKDWDWFINLSVNDYPLVTQDGIFLLLHLYSVDILYLTSFSISVAVLEAV